ncbi:MAG: hypothetical protein J07HQW1_03423 [Haloquadratum walsbyi J07HQW1]|jgi:hypothetical protein|uniref:Molybdopterin cofactor biosynthesis MoaD-related C-terminal domain-containing protein n=1 Tax=Haloquadratum walsbyi J07HQW1 TaxID=1238424 RepID=U1PIB2_9EURY|nr:MAG: hypothetical protein J07HQW1_03423 [Haloquadratum walsbyi J07HQW1]
MSDAHSTDDTRTERSADNTERVGTESSADDADMDAVSDIDIVTVERSYRGISVRLARHYLEKLGGEVVDTNNIQAESWSATLSAETVGVGPTLELTEVTVAFTGSQDALDTLIDRFSQKAMRAGG